MSAREALLKRYLQPPVSAGWFLPGEREQCFFTAHRPDRLLADSLATHARYAGRS